MGVIEGEWPDNGLCYSGAAFLGSGEGTGVFLWPSHCWWRKPGWATGLHPPSDQCWLVPKCEPFLPSWNPSPILQFLLRTRRSLYVDSPQSIASTQRLDQRNGCLLFGATTI